MHSNIPDVPAGRRVAGLSGAEPCSTPGSSGPPRPGRPAHSSVVAADTGISDARLKDLFWGTTASGADAASDICAHLCQLRRTLQADHMDARGIDCRFDIEPGRLPKPVCESLGLAIRALILDAAEHAPAGLGDKTIESRCDGGARSGPARSRTAEAARAVRPDRAHGSPSPKRTLQRCRLISGPRRATGVRSLRYSSRPIAAA